MKTRGDREERCRRVVVTPTQPAIVSEPPRQSREHEENDAGEQPEDRVALAAGRAAADQLEHDPYQQHRGDRATVEVRSGVIGLLRSSG